MRKLNKKGIHKMRNLNKKAVSPLIATVLLIAFAVALGAVVMNWGKAYVNDMIKVADEKSSTVVDCGISASLEFNKDINNYICANSTAGNLSFIIVNKGSKPISGLLVKIYSDAGINNTDVSVTLQTGHTQKFAVLYPTSFGNLTLVEIVPKINNEKTQETLTCSNAVLNTKNILSC
jgi:flagellin-like protein